MKTFTEFLTEGYTVKTLKQTVADLVKCKDEDTLNMILASVQKMLGQPHGDLAAQYFEDYLELPAAKRKKAVADYLKAEIAELV
jgi:hypothetical protein